MTSTANEKHVSADMDELSPFGESSAALITDEDVNRVLNRVLKQDKIESAQKTFSKTLFSVCPLPLDRDRSSPAGRLVDEMHGKDFKRMSNDTKILLYRACLQICRVSSEDFPYPFAFQNDFEPTNAAAEQPSNRNDALPLCPFTRPGVISDLTKNWSDADRVRLRHQVGKHVGTAAAIALIAGMVLGTLLTTPSDNRTIINVPRDGGYSAWRQDRPSDGFHRHDGVLAPQPLAGVQPSQSALIAQPLRALRRGISPGAPEITQQVPSDGGSAG